MNENEKIPAKEVTDAPISANDTTQDTQNESTGDILNNPAVTAYIEKAVQKGIQDALKGTPPKANTVDPTEQEKKNFDKMTYKERLHLFKSNPQAYQKLSKGAK